MKIVYINAVNEIRSTGRICSELSEKLKINGHQVKIIHASGTINQDSILVSSYLDCKLHSLFARIFGLSGYFSQRKTKKIVRYLEEYKPDVVHLHNLHSNFISLPILFDYLLKNKINTVVTLHDCWFFTGKCTHYTNVGCYKWKHGCGECPQLENDVPSYFFDFTKKMLSDKVYWLQRISKLKVIGVSDWIINQAKNSLIYTKEEDYKRVYNWVDLNKFKIKERNYKSGKFIILGVASFWSESKGLSGFLNASNILNDDFKIRLVGGGNDSVKGENLEIIPETHDVDHLVNLYNEADVFINLSKEESFGKVTAEAMACGTPVIVFNSTANPELVGKGCGEIINELEDVIPAIYKIKKNGKNFYTDNCIKFAKENFNLDINFNKHLDIYSSMVKRKEK